MEAVRRGVCVHVRLCEEWKWEQSGGVCVHGVVGGLCEEWKWEQSGVASVCVHSGLCEEWKWEQSGVVLALMIWTKSFSVVYCMLYRDVI